MFKHVLPALLLIATAPSLQARPHRALTPERFERSRLFRDWRLAQKTVVEEPIREGLPDRRTCLYTFQASPGLNDGFTVALKQTGINHNAAFETSGLVVTWALEEDPRFFMAGKRKLQVHRILTTLDLDPSEDALVEALAEIANRDATDNKGVAVPAPHGLSVFHSKAGHSVGFEVWNL